MIEVKNAVMRFDDKNALDGVSLTIPEGCAYGLLGSNKSTENTIKLFPRDWVLTAPENQRCSGRFPGFTGSAAESFS